jgi:hypothetical protein
MTAEVHGPRPVPGQKKGVETEHLVVIKTPNRIEHFRFFNPADAQAFAAQQRGA